MFLEGQIIEFLDSDQLRVGYVRKQERDRLHLVDPRGRNLSIAGDRVVVVHERSSEDEFPARSREISGRRVRVRMWSTFRAPDSTSVQRPAISATNASS